MLITNENNKTKTKTKQEKKNQKQNNVNNTFKNCLKKQSPYLRLFQCLQMDLMNGVILHWFYVYYCVVSLVVDNTKEKKKNVNTKKVSLLRKKQNNKQTKTKPKPPKSARKNDANYL